MTSSPVLVSSTHPHVREETRKDASNIACPITGQLTGRNTKESKMLIFTAWNIRTLLDRDSSTNAEMRTSLIAKELLCHSIDIVELSETIITDEGSVTRGGYPFFWKVKAKIKGDQIITRTSRTSNQVITTSLLTIFNELRFQLNASRRINPIEACAPELMNSNEMKEKLLWAPEKHCEGCIH